jgi:hypothetical protein
MRAIEAKRKTKRTRKGYDNLPAGLSASEAARWIKEQAELAAKGEICHKFGIKYEEWRGRWTYRFFSSEDRRDAFISGCGFKCVVL